MNLHKCERGAVMVAALFMALLLIAVLYMVIGLGRTLVMKEGMQDAADAAAYSSAIFNARGMNLIVFLNLVMAALISVLIAIRLAQSFLVFIAGVLGGMSVASFGAAAPLAALATQQAYVMGQNYKIAKAAIEPMLTVLHTAQEATSVVVPFVAMTKGMVEAARHHEPAEGAFALPGSIALPVESDDYSRLCEEGAESMVELAFSAFPEPVQRLGDHVGDAAGDLASATSAFLCGDGGGTPPVYNQRIERELPRHPEEEECQEEGSAECLELARFMESAKPLEGTGACREDCGYDGPYELMARRARLDCVPTPPYQRDNYLWHERIVEADFEYSGITWVETARRPGPLYLEGNIPEAPESGRHDDSPCGFNGTVNDHEWNTDSGFRGADEPRPVCAEEPEELLEVAEVGARKTVRFREVLRVFSCTEKTSQQIELASSDQAIGGSGSESRSPHKVEKDVVLGDEPFQIRAISFGAQPGPGSAAQGVVLAHSGESSWQERWEQARPGGEGSIGDFIRLASNVGRVAVAQAEFYFDGNAKPRDWMWEMKWTARLRHFRMPSPEETQKSDERNQGSAARVSRFGGKQPGSSGVEACQAVGGDACESQVEAVSLLDSIVRH